VEKVYFSLDNRAKISCVLLSFIVIVEPLKVEHIFTELILSILYALLLLINLRVSGLLHFLILVAVVVPSRLLAMLLPVTEAEPAKLVTAESAVHVVAPLVLLDGFPALGALLGVRHDPSYVLTLIRVFRLPTYCLLTAARSVRFLAALEAERVSALALDIADAVILVLYTVVAALVGAPPDFLVVVCVRFAEPLVVGLQIVAFEVLQEHGMRNGHITHVLRARGLHALLEPVVHSLYQPIFPVARAELMPATH
jgi:hypothetical protein